MTMHSAVNHSVIRSTQTHTHAYTHVYTHTHLSEQKFDRKEFRTFTSGDGSHLLTLPRTVGIQFKCVDGKSYRT